ncbi:MAG TPA: hypothetical protein HA230_01015 [Candidatus Aenigmarchaeota archaeon]|nr:hypothetical protein [Candidatus Aenigmarchaeota archaeon]
MKGMWMAIILAILMAIITAAIMFGYWLETSPEFAKGGQTAFGKIPAMLGSLFLCRKKAKTTYVKNAPKMRKGIAEATNLLILIVMVLLVAFILFLIFASIGAEAGPASNSIAYNAFDAILGLIP